MNFEDFHTLVEGPDHPESVAWGPDGRYFAGGEAGQIYQIDPDGNCFAGRTGFLPPERSLYQLRCTQHGLPADYRGTPREMARGLEAGYAGTADQPGIWRCGSLYTGRSEICSPQPSAGCRSQSRFTSELSINVIIGSAKRFGELSSTFGR